MATSLQSSLKLLNNKPPPEALAAALDATLESVASKPPAPAAKKPRGPDKSATRGEEQRSDELLVPRASADQPSVARDIQAAGAAAAGAEVGPRSRCVKCGVEKAAAEFSRKMRTRPASRRRCSACVLAAASAGGLDAQGHVADRHRHQSTAGRKRQTSGTRTREKSVDANDSAGSPTVMSDAADVATETATAAPNRAQRRELAKAKKDAAASVSSTADTHHREHANELREVNSLPPLSEENARRLAEAAAGAPLPKKQKKRQRDKHKLQPDTTAALSAKQEPTRTTKVAYPSRIYGAWACCI